jgi:hypothetical protein
MVVGAGALGGHALTMVAVLAYGLGAIALGAQSVGHEYSCRTLGLLLSQPADRRRLFSVKLVVLGVFMLALTGIASRLPDPGSFHRFFLVLPALCGLCLAPSLTMLARNPVGGAVFTVAVPTFVLFVGDLLGLAIYGSGRAAEIDVFKLEAFWWGTLALCAGSAIWSWRLFTCLEDIESGGAFLHLPVWSTRKNEEPRAGAIRTSAHRNTLWLLVAKELRLQQMAFVVAAIYVMAWAGSALTGRWDAEIQREPFVAVTMLYLGLLSMLIGSVASAEERQFGTIEWQVLLPMAARRQWAVKVGTMLGLALILGIGIPEVFRAAGETALQASQPGRWSRTPLLSAAVLMACSLAASSISTSGLRALLLSAPFGLAVLFIVMVVGPWLWWVSWNVSLDLAIREGALATRIPSARSFRIVSEWLSILLALGFVALLTRFACQNHVSSEHGIGRLARQGLWCVGYLALGILLGVFAAARLAS